MSENYFAKLMLTTTFISLVSFIQLNQMLSPISSQSSHTNHQNRLLFFVFCSENELEYLVKSVLRQAHSWELDLESNFYIVEERDLTVDLEPKTIVNIIELYNIKNVTILSNLSFPSFRLEFLLEELMRKTERRGNLQETEIVAVSEVCIHTYTIYIDFHVSPETRCSNFLVTKSLK